MSRSRAEGGVPALWRRAVIERRGAGVLLLPLLWVLSVPWLVVVRVSEGLYRFGLLRARRGALPVISVGNISVGGTGKTTTCIYLARELMARKVTAGIVLRGYKRRGAGALLVSDEDGLRCGPEAAGDEAYLLARQLPGCPVAVCRRRERALELLAAHTHARVAILDDGYQYYRLAREIDLVLLDAFTPREADHVFPAGLLREPYGHLNRATDIWLTHTDIADGDRVACLRAVGARHAPGARLAETAHKPSGLCDWDGTEVDAAIIRDRPIVAVAGIGNPESFFDMVGELTTGGVTRVQFPDHHAYDERDWETVGAAAREVGASVLTTPKDAVKMPPPPADVEVYVVAPSLSITSGEEAVEALLGRACMLLEEGG